LLLLTSSGRVSLQSEWYTGFELARESERGIRCSEDHLYIARFDAVLQPGVPLVIALSADPNASADQSAFQRRQNRDQEIIDLWVNRQASERQDIPDWVRQTLLAADQFIVTREIPGNPSPATRLSPAITGLLTGAEIP